MQARVLEGLMVEAERREREICVVVDYIEKRDEKL